MTKIVAISDLHGVLPKIPQCDLLLIAGDITPTKNHSVSFQYNWLNNEFRKWLDGVPAKNIVGVAGNHDFIFQESSPPKLPWIYLQDSGVEINGLKLWGTPWQPWFFDWAFNLYEPQLAEKWASIPNDTDILVCHGPPFGYGDEAVRLNKKGYENTGSPSLLKRIKEIKPKLVTFGHIHRGRGEWILDGTKLANVSILNDNYENVYEPWEYNL